MKKFSKIFIALLLVIVALFCVAGCNADIQNELQSKIDELQAQVDEMNDRIEQLEQELKILKGKTGDYFLKISSDKQVYNRRDEILIDIIFINDSGYDVNIAYYFLFHPISSTGQFPDHEQPPVTTKLIFKNGDIIRRTERLGGCFPVGQHELIYHAVFYLEWEMTEFGYETTDSRVEIVSNTIEFSVVE